MTRVFGIFVVFITLTACCKTYSLATRSYFELQISQLRTYKLAHIHSSAAGKFAFELAHVEVVVESFFSHEFIVRAKLFNFAAVDSHNIVRVLNGAEPVGNNEAGYIT